MVGGIIASVVPIISFFTENKRWRIEKRLAHLKARRSELEVMFLEIRKTLADDMRNDQYTNDVILQIVHRSPKSVWTAFDAMMRETDRSPKNLVKHHLNISETMMIELAELERKIESLVDY